MSASESAAPTDTEARAAAEFLVGQHTPTPRVAIVLGTGLGGLADRIEERTVIPYAGIPHFPRATVAGHAGRLVLGTLRGVPIVAMQGRFHLYEGYAPRQVVLPVRALRILGADTLIVTNAAGGLNPTFNSGDLMLIRDHIGLATLAGQNPLIGPNDDQLGPRFPAMTGAYDVALRTLAQEVASQIEVAVRDGVYAMVSGPSYETPAELGFLRAIGADAVGMSTVPEVIAARHVGMRVLAISVVTNVALAAEGSAPPEPNHAEVVAVAERAGENLGRLIEEIVARL